MQKFPYKDEEINRWVYDKVPEKMELVTSPLQVKTGSTILFKSSLSSLDGLFIATKITTSNRSCVLSRVSCGDIYVLKSGVSNK